MNDPRFNIVFPKMLLPEITLFYPISEERTRAPISHILYRIHCQVNDAVMSGKIRPKTLREAGILSNLAKPNNRYNSPFNLLDMFTQPELGKMIADLRKSKGWTQEELVEKCNLSVRTIQRIESGEVTPRSYTTRLLLSALEYDLHVLESSRPGDQKSSSDPGKSSSGLIPWIHSLPLPDKKTITSFFSQNALLMKKVILLSLALCAAAYGLFMLFSKSDAQKTEEAKQYIAQADKNCTRWFNAGQIDSIVNIYTDDACLFPILAPNICGRMAIYQHLQSQVDIGYIIVEQTTEKFRMDGSIAITSGTWKVKGPDGALINGKFNTEWHKVGKKWLMYYDCGSPTP